MSTCTWLKVDAWNAPGSPEFLAYLEGSIIEHIYIEMAVSQHYVTETSFRSPITHWISRRTINTMRILTGSRQPLWRAAGGVAPAQHTCRCIVCDESKTSKEFPESPPTSLCSHPSNTCRDCIRGTVQSQSEDNLSSGISCPVCPQALNLDEVQLYMDDALFQK